MSSEIVLPLHDNRIRIAERMQLVQDAASAFALIPAGLARLHSVDPVQHWFAYVELAAVAALAVMTVREFRDREDITPGIGWLNLTIGGVLILESLLQTHEGHKWFTPALLTGMVSIMLGVFQGRIRTAKRNRGQRSMRVTDEGIAIRFGKFRRFDRAWADISTIEREGDVFIITPRTGKAVKVKLKRYGNRDEVEAALRAATESHRLAIRG